MRRRKADTEGRERIRREFLCMALCHELKQPLHTLNLNVELISKRLGAAAEAPEISGPLQAFGRVVERVNGTLDAFGLRTLPPPIGSELHDVRAILEQAAERARVQVIAPPLPRIACSPEALDYALDALIDNALRASRPGGEIVLNARADKDEILIDVIDHGGGMSPDVARHAFEIGYSGWGREGIGLTLAKFIVYHHGGGFSVQSREEQGTTVNIALPRTGEGSGVAVGD